MAANLIPHDPFTPDGEPVKGKTYIADGWVYRDLPRMTPENFDRLVALLGEENIVWLTVARYSSGARRGQFLLSPAGQQRLLDHSAQSTPTKDTPQ